MAKTVAVIAPMIDRKQGHVNFTLRLKRNNRELTLARLYELARDNYTLNNIHEGYSYAQETIPAAGYYLTGLLREHGYDTILTNEFDLPSLEQIASTDPLAVCISSTMIVDHELFQEIIANIRHIMPDICIIVGGVYIWKNYHQYVQSSQLPAEENVESPVSVFQEQEPGAASADIFVVSEHGRTSLLMVLQELERGTNADFPHIPNLAIRQPSAGFAFTARALEEVDYNSDYTRWDLLDDLPMRIPIRTSIGCPFRCRFCDFCHLYPKIFLRSKESLLAELHMIKRKMREKSSMLHVTDDNVFINANRVYDVCQALIESEIGGWAGFMRSSTVNATNIDLITRSGLLLSMVGVESGDAGQLERMNKAQKLDDVKQGIELLDGAGISVLMTYLVGYPGETAETIDNTAAFINALSINTSSSNYQVYPLNILPSSDLAAPEYRAKWKITGLHDVWSHYTMNSEEAVEYCYTLFKKVPFVPYHYAEESNFFNRSLDPMQRRILFRLRQRLTVQLLEGDAWQAIAETLANMSQVMEFPKTYPDESFRNEIVI